ncbi:MAG TPA: ABC transporter permease [Planctomycetota bacterium]|jgi:ABC-type polysaccharide/polyol phosphate export permease|nr:ABC transporter permease [Planctomycetota bacterium]
MDTPSIPVRTVTAQPPGWGARLAAAARFPALVARHRDLLAAFVRRDVQARFQGSVLGRLWPLLQPGLLFGLYYLVFVSILKFRFDEAGLKGAQVPLWLFLGVILWGAFATTIQRATVSIVDNGNLVKMATFPSELLPLSIALAEGAVFGLAFAVYAALHVALGLPVPASALLLPLLLPGLLAFALGVSLFTAAAHVFVRDTANLVSLGLTFWMFLTPVFWPAANLAKGLPPTFSAVLRENPMYHAVEGARALVGLYGEAPLPWGSIVALLAEGGVALLLGYSYFLGARQRFVDEI